MADLPRCVLVKAGLEYEGRQGLRYAAGLTRATAGSRRLSLAIARLPPGARSRVHLHRGVESAGYRPATALVAHSAPDDQEGIVLLPELERLVDSFGEATRRAYPPA